MEKNRKRKWKLLNTQSWLLLVISSGTCSHIYSFSGFFISELYHYFRCIMEQQGQKQYPCGQCDSAFTTRSSVLTHKKIIHGDKIFSCDQCNYSSTWRDNLKRHKRRMHEKKQDKIENQSMQKGICKQPKSSEAHEDLLASIICCVRKLLRKGRLTTARPTVVASRCPTLATRQHHHHDSSSCSSLDFVR